MIAVAQIREQLRRLVEDPNRLEEFEDWIVQKSWNMHLDSDPVAQALVASIELRLAEHSGGHLSLDQMIEDFYSLLNGYVVLNVRLNADPSPSHSGSSISFEVEQSQPPALSAERQLLTVYG